MTTAHRPTFDPARGKDASKASTYHQRILPAHTHLKVRQAGQGSEADRKGVDLRAELLKAEAANLAKSKGVQHNAHEPDSRSTHGKRAIEDGLGDSIEDEDIETKRRRILEETRDIDADSDGSDEDSESEESDEEDETAELMRELEKIKKERAEQREREERERAAKEEEEKEHEIARGNPLLNKTDFTIKRRWDDDVIFKNQARGTENRDKKEFVNDLLRSDFHKRFMSKYVR